MHPLRRESAAIRKQLAVLLDAQGTLLCASGEHEAAIACFTEAISLDSLRAPYWTHRAIASLRVEAWGRALKDLEHSLSLDSTSSPDLWVLRGKLYWKFGMPDRGNRDFKARVAGRRRRSLAAQRLSSGQTSWPPPQRETERREPMRPTPLALTMPARRRHCACLDPHRRWRGASPQSTPR